MSDYISGLALVVSFFALFSTIIYRKVDARSWFVVENIQVVDAPNNQLRVVGDMKHVSGGPALDVKFKIGINDQASKYEGEALSLLPNDTQRIQSHAIGGWHPAKDDVISFTFEYSDVYGYPYELKQSMLQNGKQMGYFPKIIRSVRSLWLKI